MQPTIRSATAADVGAVLTLWRDADAEPSHTDDVRSLEQLLDFDRGALLVAECEGRVVGSVVAGWDGWRGSIYRLAVHPEHRRRGLAGELVRAAVARLETLGAARLQAFVVDDDLIAMGFWGSSGWERQTHRARFVLG